ELWKRVGQVRAELEAAGSAGHVAVVTHAGAIRAWRAQAEGRAWAELLAEPIGFGSVHLLG
ncbi:MAG TPA: histidine phosphatase family protein, partial [Opitutaceae bacterium]|nr:histidine phosphatase family protein [Opitutaceae bacterium]